jgi:hypothetical protein
VFKVTPFFRWFMINLLPDRASYYQTVLEVLPALMSGKRGAELSCTDKICFSVSQGTQCGHQVDNLLHTKVSACHNMVRRRRDITSAVNAFGRPCTDINMRYHQALISRSSRAGDEII